MLNFGSQWQHLLQNLQDLPIPNEAVVGNDLYAVVGWFIKIESVVGPYWAKEGLADMDLEPVDFRHVVVRRDPCIREFKIPNKARSS